VHSKSGTLGAVCQSSCMIQHQGHWELDELGIPKTSA